MPTMTVTLTPVQSAHLDGLVAEGRFASPDQAVEHLLSRVLDEDIVSSYSPTVLAHLQQGFDEVRRGEFVSQEQVEAMFEGHR